MARYKFDDKRNCMLVLNEKTGRWIKDRVKKTKAPIAGAFFMPDIKPFVANATDKPVEITSRSQLARYERANQIRQCGDYRTGEMISRVNARSERDMREASRLARETGLHQKVKHFEWQ